MLCCCQACGCCLDTVSQEVMTQMLAEMLMYYDERGISTMMNEYIKKGGSISVDGIKISTASKMLCAKLNTEHNKKFDAAVIQVVLEDFSHEKNFIEFDRFKKVVKHIVKTHFPWIFTEKMRDIGMRDEQFRQKVRHEFEDKWVKQHVKKINSYDAIEVLYNILDDSPTVKRDVRISREYLLDLLQEGWMLCYPGEKWSDVGDMAESPFADCILYMMNHPQQLKEKLLVDNDIITNNEYEKEKKKNADLKEELKKKEEEAQTQPQQVSVPQPAYQAPVPYHAYQHPPIQPDYHGRLQSYPTNPPRPQPYAPPQPQQQYIPPQRPIQQMQHQPPIQPDYHQRMQSYPPNPPQQQYAPPPPPVGNYNQPAQHYQPQPTNPYQPAY